MNEDPAKRPKGFWAWRDEKEEDCHQLFRNVGQEAVGAEWAAHQR